jgi:tape measure domain-containing protein
VVAKMELASAYVTLNVSTKAMGKQIGQMFGQVERQASTSGKRMGQSIQKGMNSASSSSLGDLQKRLADGEARLTQAVEQGSKRRSAAQRQVKIAEAELSEAKAKGEAQSSRVLAAEDRLIRAREHYSSVSKQAISEIRTHSDAVKQAQSAIDGMAGASGRAGSAIRSAFSGIGAKIGASFQGAQAVAGTVFSGLKSAASVAASGISSVFSGVGSVLRNVFTGNFSGAFNQIVTGARTAGSAVSTAFSNVWGGFTNGLANARSNITSTAGGMVSSFSGAAARTGEAVRGGLSRGFDGIRTVASRSAAENFAAFTSGAGNAASRVGSALSGGFRSTTGAAVNAARGGFSAFTSGVGNVASTIGSKISGGFRSTVSAAANAAKNGASAMASGFSGVGSKIGSVLSRGFSGIPSLAGKTGNQAGQAMTSNLMSHLGRIPAMVGSLVGVAGIGGILSAGFKRMNDIDHANIIFKNIGLTSKQAKDQMAKLNDQVTGTSTSLSTASKVSGLLAQSGVEMGEGMDASIKALTNLSAASGASADDIGMVMLQMKSSGHLYTQDLLQMTQRGINAFGMLADSMGISQEEVRKQVSDGKLTYEDFVKAVNEGTGELAKEMGTTLPAKLTILKTAFANLGMQAIEPFKKQIGGALDAVTQFLKTVVTPKVKEFATWMTGNSESAKKFRDNIMLAAAAVGGLVTAFAGLWAGVKIFKMIQGVAAAVSSPFLLLVSAIGLAIGAAVVAYGKFAWFRDLVDNIFWRIKLGIGLFMDAWSNADKHVSASGIPGFFQGLGKFARTALDTLVDLAKDVGNAFWDYFGPSVEDSIPTIKDLGKFIGKAADVMEKLGKFLGDTADVWVPFAVGLGIAIGVLKIYNGVAAIAAALTGAISWPVLAVVAAITLLVGGFILMYKKVGWFHDFMDGLWAGIKDGAENFAQWWTQTFWPGVMAVFGFLGGFFVGLWDIVVTVWGNITGVIGGFLTWWTETFWPGVQTVLGWFGSAFQTIGEFLSGIWGWVTSVFQGFLTWWTESFWPGISNPLNALGQAFQWFNDAIIQPVWSWIKTTIGGFFDWWSGIFWPGLQTTITLLGIAFTWFRDNIVTPVWTAISNVISWAWHSIIQPIWNGIVWFINSILIPGFQWLGTFISNIWNWISNIISWAWNVVVKPIWNAIIAFINGILIPGFQWLGQFISNIWNWIVSVISWAWNNMIKPIWTALKWFIDYILIPGFQWLGQFISNIWNWIVQIISWAWNVAIKPIWDAIKWFIDNILIPAFQWLGTKIKMIWDWIGNIIGSTWTWLRDSIFNPMMNFIQNNLVQAWDNTANLIRDAWDKLRDAVKKPIKFVVDKVVNPFVGAYNTVKKAWGGKDIDELKPKGWATGGYTGPGGKYDPAGIVHADEYVIKKSSRKKFEQRYPGYLDAINSTGDLPDSPKNAYAKGGNGIAAGTVPPHGPGTNVWGSMQAEASKAGKMVFKATNISGVDTESAAKAWMGRSALDVKMGNGGPGVSSFVNGNSGGWGYYSGNQIQVSSAVPANRVRGVLVHEMGHALGLDHVGMGDSSSVMDHMMTGGDWPHSGDYQALRELWGEPGKGVKTYENPGGGGGSGSSWIVEAVRKIVDSVFNKGRDLARGKFKGNDFVEDGIGVGQTSVDGIIDWLSQLFGGGGSNDSGGESSKPAEQWRSTVIEALKRVGLPTSNDYVNAWIRQIASESGGNPNAVQGNIGDINNATGDIAKGLVQVIGSTFAAYRDPSLPNDRFNPLASLVAGMRYAKATYGISGMLGAIGHGHGYSEGGRVKKATLFDGGGKLDKGIQFIDHQRDKPDYVLTHEQWRAMYSIAENSASKSQGMVINGGIHGYSAEEVGREVEKQRKRREALYA